MVRGTVFNVQRFCLHDGAGIRTTVFLKGCPLLCGWCHNPESQALRPERVQRADRCIHCGSCITHCRHGALSLSPQGDVVHDRSRCTLDGACAAACPTGATEVIGRSMSVAEVMAEVRRDQLLYDESGGGVTFSGGEPLHQPEFLAALLLQCRSEGIRTTLDTCGHAPTDEIERIIPLADAVLLDLKHVDDEMHRVGTGISNRTIMDNLLRIRRITAEYGSALDIRVPLIAGYNDGDADVEQLAALLLTLHPTPAVDLLPCQDYASAKYERMHRPVPHEWHAPSAARQREIALTLEQAGIRTTIRGEKQCH